MKPASTQTDRNLNFDGIGEGPRKGSSKYAGNKWSGHSNDGREVNFGRGPTRGNNGSEPGAKNVGAPVTKDSFRRAPDHAGSVAGTSVDKPKNLDYINGGAQVRNPGGTRSWDPKKGQNYSGNPDMIRAGQQGGPGYGATSRGSRPVAAGRTDGINYGPKKQY